MIQIDLNCDVGEEAGHDAELMQIITSANIACGGHAGDDDTMCATAALAKLNHVAVGAHPGFADKEHFGRRDMHLSMHEIESMVTDQVERLLEITPIRHVKPHGALYNMAARDHSIASAIVAAVKRIDPELIVVGLAGSAMIDAARRAGLRAASEVFADRTYQRDGTLTPRGEPNAMIADETESLEQVLRMLNTGRVRAIDGTLIEVQADTICLHGDGANAVAIARRLRSQLELSGIKMASFV